MEEKTVRGLREIAVLVFFACALFFLISLITFNIEDAGWTHSGALQTISNAGGVFGAWLSDFSLSFFGLIAYLFPAIIFWQGYMIHRAPQQSTHLMNFVLQWLGILTTVVSGAALSYLYLPRIQVELPNTTGGIIGQETGNALLLLFGNSGATLFLLVGLLGGITLVTELSWLAVLDFIGKYTVSFFRLLLRSAGNLKPERYTTDSINKTATTSIQSSAQGPMVKPAKAEKPKKIDSKITADAHIAPVLEKVMAETEKTFKQASKKMQKKQFDAGQNVLPSLELLDNRDTRVKGYTQSDLEEMSRLVENILQDFNISVEVVGFLPGPVIT
ncbi:MAG: DNA translocase FtsK 4TM domain-containing protein, partial [Gammaproteobacteria bacterium]